MQSNWCTTAADGWVRLSSVKNAVEVIISKTKNSLTATITINYPTYGKANAPISDDLRWPLKVIQGQLPTCPWRNNPGSAIGTIICYICYDSDGLGGTFCILHTVVEDHVMHTNRGCGDRQSSATERRQRAETNCSIGRRVDMLVQHQLPTEKVLLCRRCWEHKSACLLDFLTSLYWFYTVLGALSAFRANKHTDA